MVYKVNGFISKVVGVVHINLGAIFQIIIFSNLTLTISTDITGGFACGRVVNSEQDRCQQYDLYLGSQNRISTTPAARLSITTFPVYAAAGIYDAGDLYSGSRLGPDWGYTTRLTSSWYDRIDCSMYRGGTPCIYRVHGRDSRNEKEQGSKLVFCSLRKNGHVQHFRKNQSLAFPSQARLLRQTPA